MSNLAGWPSAAHDTLETAFGAHRQLGGIHPFNDGNGRTALPLMNLILIRGGYPPVAVHPEDRPAIYNCGALQSLVSMPAAAARGLDLIR